MPPPTLTDRPLVLEIHDLDAVPPRFLDAPVTDPRHRDYDRGGDRMTPPGGRRGHPAPRLPVRGGGRNAARHRGDTPDRLRSRRGRRRAGLPRRMRNELASVLVVSACAVVAIWLGAEAPANSPVSASSLTRVPHEIR